ncbi:MAG TPA: hypothetical protein VEO74_09470, partial [Thermoanaerobaculia bacterium]|nr:hypothetical protein [Thermoanaerobaculia bacterium]
MPDAFMQAAIEEAERGLAEGGIPIGSVLVHRGKIGTTSIHIDFEVRRKENPDQVVASGKYIVVTVKKGEFAPTPVPQA